MHKECFRAINWLRKNHDIIITKPDKGSGVVLLNKNDYVDKMNEIFDDQSKFKRLGPFSSNDNTASIESHLQKQLLDLVKVDLMPTAPINSRLNVVVRSPTLFGLGRNGCWPSRGSQLPRALPFIFSLCCPLNDCRRAAHSIYKIGRLFSLFLFSCPTLALLLLLMSGNVHPNPGPIFPCSVCTGNVTWRGKSVQCCTCSKWVHLRCSQLSLSKFRALGSSHSWSCFP